MKAQIHIAKSNLNWGGGVRAYYVSGPAKAVSLASRNLYVVPHPLSQLAPLEGCIEISVQAEPVLLHP